MTMTEHVEIQATITDRWGQVETVRVGSQPSWAWELDRCAAWRKMMRALLLSDRTSDPRGWRVTFAETDECAGECVTRPQYVATMNTPGYLPWADEPAVFDTAQEAWAYLAGERERQEDDAYSEGDAEEYSETWEALTRRGSDKLLVCDFERVGTVYGETPGSDSEHDLGIAYSVTLAETDDV